MTNYEIIKKNSGRASGVGYPESFSIYKGKVFICSCPSMYLAKKIKGLLNAK